MNYVVNIAGPLANNEVQERKFFKDRSEYAMLIQIYMN